MRQNPKVHFRKSPVKIQRFYGHEYGTMAHRGSNKRTEKNLAAAATTAAYTMKYLPYLHFSHLANADVWRCG